MSYHHGNLREALLERAADVIAERGVEALTLRGLARDLGVSHGAPRRHFADRNALLGELARDGFRRAREAMEAGAKRAGTDPVACYRALGRSYVAFARENRSYFLAANHPAVLAEAGPALRTERREWFGALRRGVESARAAGWHPDIEIETLAAFSCAAAMGTAMLLADQAWCALLGTKDIDALADRVLDLVVHRSRTGSRRATQPVVRKKTKRRIA